MNYGIGLMVGFMFVMLAVAMTVKASDFSIPDKFAKVAAGLDGNGVAHMLRVDATGRVVCAPRAVLEPTEPPPP
jgi:hypothetical protein